MTTMPPLRLTADADDLIDAIRELRVLSAAPWRQPAHLRRRIARMIRDRVAHEVEQTGTHVVIRPSGELLACLALLRVRKGRP